MGDVVNQFQWSVALAFCCLLTVSQESIGGTVVSVMAQKPAVATPSKFIIEKQSSDAAITQDPALTPHANQLAQADDLDSMGATSERNYENVEYNLPIYKAGSLCSFKLPANFYYKDSNEFNTTFMSDDIIVKIFHNKTNYPTPKIAQDRLISSFKNGADIRILSRSVRDDGFTLLTDFVGRKTYTNMVHVNGISCGVSIIYERDDLDIDYIKNIIGSTLHLSQNTEKTALNSSNNSSNNLSQKTNRNPGKPNRCSINAPENYKAKVDNVNLENGKVYLSQDSQVRISLFEIQDDQKNNLDTAYDFVKSIFNKDRSLKISYERIMPDSIISSGIMNKGKEEFYGKLLQNGNIICFAYAHFPINYKNTTAAKTSISKTLSISFNP
jgi:hypothetical protein